MLTKRGDVIILLGKENGNCGKLLVSSAILSTVSAVFEAMFDGRFAEGQALSAEKPKEIPVPDDDPICITMLCKIIHLQTNDVPAELSMKQLADFAVLCDRYCCIDAVRPWSRLWVAQLASKVNDPDFEKLLFATYVLDLPHEFCQVSRSLITDRAAPLKIEIAVHGHQLLPLKVFDYIYANRELAIHQTIGALLPVAVGHRSTQDCDAAQNTPLYFVQCLYEAKVWPPPSLCISEIKAKISQMDKIPQDLCEKVIRALCCKGSSVSKAGLVKDLDGIIASVKGCCLDCVKGETFGVKVKPCRVPHK